MYDDFLSTVTSAPISYAVYSALSFYGRRRGGELPGSWLVRGLGLLGHATPAVRQTLFRMERTGVLNTRRAGRVKFYRLSPLAQAEADAGLAKILGPRPEAWDGQWTLLQARFDSSERARRERLYELLRSEGFAPLGAGVFIHPRDRAVRVLQAANQEGIGDRLMIVRGARQGSEPTSRFVPRHWNLETLESEYRQFVARFAPVLRRQHWSDRQAFVLRFAVVLSYLEPAWRDPELPSALLPAAWPGRTARMIAARLYKRLLPGALRFADALLPASGRRAGAVVVA